MVSLALSLMLALPAGAWAAEKNASDAQSGQPASNESSRAYKRGTLQNTRSGQVEGFAKDGALHWYGIPYAKEPVGALRWKAPQPVEPWTGVKDATKSLTGSQIANVTGDDGKITRQLVGSEAGSVSLDITRPDTDETGLPVLYYIHGGNNQTGNSTDLPATQFAKEINSVVVSVNLRMGLLGHITLPALRHGTPEENSGNYGMLDLAAALDWVKENAESFGADGGNITVSGSSAGGRNVMAMLISPFFKDKFQKAISFSGGMTTANVEDSQRMDARALAPLAVAKGVQPDRAAAEQWLLTDSADVKTFLYSLSDEELARAFGGAGIRMSAFPHHFADGVVLPAEGFGGGKYLTDVPVLMVNGNSEFSTFVMRSAPFSKFSDAELMKNRELLRQYEFAEKYGSLMYGYFNGEESAERMLKAGYKAPIYTCIIMWGEDPKVVGELFATIRGSYHIMSTPLMTRKATGIAAKYPDLFASEGCQAVSTLLNAYYKNFLWTGNPNGEGLPEWKPWSGLKGTTQLIVDGNDKEAWAAMSSEHISYKQIIEMMEKDATLPPAEKEAMIQTILNGRWFSQPLDDHFHNESLWK